METLNIIKIGGNSIDNPEQLTTFLTQYSSIPGKKILVHGGGKLASELLVKMNIPVMMHEGKRITNKETLEVACMVYAGLINKTIVSKLQSNNCNAIGLSGADANSIYATKRETNAIDYGWVGDIQSVNSEFIQLLLVNNLHPVFCAITHTLKGQLLNSNADAIASHLAVALNQLFDVQLIYCFEKSGVLKNVEEESSIIRNMKQSEYETLKAQGKIHSGMIAKLDKAFLALQGGVKNIRIGHSEKLIQLTSNISHEGTHLQL